MARYNVDKQIADIERILGAAAVERLEKGGHLYVTSEGAMAHSRSGERAVLDLHARAVAREARASKPAGWQAPTQAQLDYAADLGVTVTGDMSRSQVSAAISAAKMGQDAIAQAWRDGRSHGINGEIWDHS